MDTNAEIGMKYYNNVLSGETDATLPCGCHIIKNYNVIPHGCNHNNNVPVWLFCAISYALKHKDMARVDHLIRLFAWHVASVNSFEALQRLNDYTATHRNERFKIALHLDHNRDMPMFAEIALIACCRTYDLVVSSTDSGCAFDPVYDVETSPNHLYGDRIAKVIGTLNALIATSPALQHRRNEIVVFGKVLTTAFKDGVLTDMPDVAPRQSFDKTRCFFNPDVAERAVYDCATGMLHMSFRALDYISDGKYPRYFKQSGVSHFVIESYKLDDDSSLHVAIDDAFFRSGANYGHIRFSSNYA